MRKAEARGRDLEMAVAIGVGEALVMTGGSAPPEGTDEMALAGALQGSPVRLAPCRTVALEVPVDSEVVLEGRIRAGARVTDGPYLDYAGIASTNPSAYQFEVSAVLRREQPVFRGTSVGIPGGEDHVMFSFFAQLGLVDFHGSRLRHAAQSALLRGGRFRAFQLSGRVGAFLRRGME
jgi:UbiD family decarboxylase